MNGYPALHLPVLFCAPQGFQKIENDAGRCLEIRTRMNVYGDVATDEVAMDENDQASSKVAVALNRFQDGC
jgi:hypothetical protein